jgi:subtilase family serine protease
VFGGEIRYNVVATKAAEFVSATYARNKNFFLFVHFCEPDLFGHFYGENSAEYSRAIISNDEGVGIIINKLKELDIYDDTLVIVTTDHGAKENSKNATFISGPQGRKWLVGLGPLHGQKDMDNHLIWMVNNKYVLSETILHTQIAHIILNALGIPTSTPVFDLFFQKGISFSGDFVENSVLNINGTVGNDGIFPAYNFTVQLLINNNPIENKTYSLTPNGSVEVSFNWAAEPGNHNIIILIDPLDKFREYNETNNSAIANLYIHSLPDLSIFNEDIIFSNNEPIENDTIYINATVHIESELPIAENITVEFVMDNETLNTQEIFIRMNSTVNVSFFWTAIKGTHNITIKVDSTNTVSESNETNNEATKQITVQPKTPPAPTPQIDLFITSSDITFSNDNPREEDNVTITATVHAVNLTENISIAVELLIDSNLKANRTVLISNASITIQFNWTAVKGEHNITIEIDTTNVVTESNETNNIATREISVMARAAPPPPGEPSEIPWFYLGIALAMIVAIIAVAISVLFIMRKKMGKKKGNHDV